MCCRIVVCVLCFCFYSVCVCCCCFLQLIGSKQTFCLYLRVCVCVCVLCVPVRDVSCVLSKCACVCVCVRPAVVVCGECGVMPCVVVVLLVFIETSVNCFSFCSLSLSPRSRSFSLCSLFCCLPVRAAAAQQLFVRVANDFLIFEGCVCAAPQSQPACLACRLSVCVSALFARKGRGRVTIFTLSLFAFNRFLTATTTTVARVKKNGGWIRRGSLIMGLMDVYLCINVAKGGGKTEREQATTSGEVRMPCITSHFVC